MSGTLYVVGTPIGNLGDLTERARATLGSVDRIAAEDTRRTGRLLEHLGIDQRMVSYYEGNEARRTDELVALLEGGEDIALVTDAGMPGVSDPGERLVRGCIEREIDVVVIPGPSAVLAALIASGLPMDRFVFEGFLPRTGTKRRERLDALATDPRTSVIFESPRRTAATLSDLGGAFGPAHLAAVCRELTKLHEEVVRGTLEELIAAFAPRDDLKGEVVIVVAGAGYGADDEDEEDREARVAAALEVARALANEGSKPRAAASAAASEFGVRANEVYEAMQQR